MMTLLRKGILLLLCLSLRGVERFESSGFCAEISRTGTLKTISCGGSVLLKNFRVTGSCDLPPDRRKGSSLLVPSGKDAKVTVKQQKDTMLVSLETTLGTESIPDAASSFAHLRLSPESMEFSIRVITKKELRTRYRLFYCRANLDLKQIAGRGMLTVGRNGERFLQLIPENEAVTKNCSGKLLAFSLNADQSLFLESLENSWFSLEDGRKWGRFVGMVEMAHSPHLSETPVSYPPGSVFQWRFRVSMRKENDGVSDRRH